MFQLRAGVSAEALPSMSLSYAVSPPPISGRRSPASHTLNIRKSTVMLTPSFILTTFCCGLQPLIDQMAALQPVYQTWYMDDGGIVGSPELLLKVWEILKKGGVPLGLELNSKKCEWSWLNPDCNLVCPIDGVPITPTSEIQILGVPLGSQEFTESFVKGTF